MLAYCHQFLLLCSIHVPILFKCKFFFKVEQLYSAYPGHTWFSITAGGLRERLADVQPALLLFLHRLQCLCVSDALQPASSNVMLRRQLGRHVVELRHGNKAQHTQHWLVVK